MLVRAPTLVPLRPVPDLKLPATASPEQRVTWLDTASRMLAAEPVPDQAPPGEMVNVVAASAGAASSAVAAATNAGMASRPILCFMIPPQRSETRPRASGQDCRRSHRRSVASLAAGPETTLTRR